MKPDLVCCFRVNARKKPDGGQIVADLPARLDAWIKKYVMATGRQPTGDMALHGLWNTTQVESSSPRTSTSRSAAGAARPTRS